MNTSKHDQTRSARLRVARAASAALLAVLFGWGPGPFTSVVRGDEGPAPTTEPTQPADSAQAAPTTAPAKNDDPEVDAGVVSKGLDDDGQVALTVGKSRSLISRVAVRTVEVSQPDLVFIKVISPTEVLLTARKPGMTQMMLWDVNGRSQSIDVTIGSDLHALQRQFKTLFPTSSIETIAANGGVVLRGRVPNLQAADQAMQVAQPYGAKVFNFLEVAGGQQVMLQVRFAEVSKSATTELGVNFGFTDGAHFGGSNIGQVSPVGIKPLGDTGTQLGISTPNPAVTLFGTAGVGRTQIAFFIDALRRNNLLRVLAEPTLIAISGQDASFLAGGEFPIPVPQPGGGGGAAAITVEYKQFGVRLHFLPVVLGDGKIRLKVEPEVSDLDFSQSVSFNGFVIPSLTKRTLETTVELSEGQTFAVAGLLNNRVNASKDATPILGDIPILGALFRSVRYTRNETELVVLVTPHIVGPMNPGQVPALPGENWRHPTEAELFIMRDLGGPAADTTHSPQNSATANAPRFHGQYGFTPAAPTR